MDPQKATRIALDVEHVQSASFTRTLQRNRAVGVVYDSLHDVEYDVRQTDTGWNVNDDDGRNYTARTLRRALKRAIKNQ